MVLLAQGKKQAEIAKALGRSSSTISRELKRHALENYSATSAQNSYLKHRQNSKAQRTIKIRTISFINQLLNYLSWYLFGGV